MRIGILSDTHDHLENVAAAAHLLNARGVELVLHLGDWVAPFVPLFLTRGAAEPLRCPVKGIFGNNDGDPMLFLKVVAQQQAPVEMRRTVFPLEADGRRIIAYHGTDPEITEALLACRRYDAVFTGHTHDPFARLTDGVLHVNPGTLSGIRAGKPGHPPTLALYDTVTNTAEIVTLP
ncbi:MAG TPA: metallophosphoesterase [Armatimonadota bacterium]|nr:metallophosphoesterase [Armatimonadota bacterium]